MKMPVIIAAYNEADYIGRCLTSLPAAEVEPIVVTNGCTDETAALARSFGVTTYELDIPAKLPAIQHGLRQLGRRALEPVLYIDADTYPLYPTRWVSAMTRQLDSDHRSASGLVIASDDIAQPDRALMSTFRIANAFDKKLRGKGHISGGNLATLLSIDDTLEEVLALEPTWPGEDVLLATTATNGFDTIRFVINPHAVVRTSSRYLTNPLDVVTALLRGGPKSVRQKTFAERLARGHATEKAYPLD